MKQQKLKEHVRERLAQRDWTVRKLAEVAQIAPSSAGRTIQDNEFVGCEVTIAVAQAIGTPPDVLLELGGFLPAKPPESQETRTLQYIYQRLDDAKRQQLLDYARFLEDRQ